MAAARLTTPPEGTRLLPGASRRSATGRARRASSQTATSCVGAGAGRKRVVSDGSLDEKGAVGGSSADEAHRGDERVRSEADGEDLVARLDGFPGDGGSHDC